MINRCILVYILLVSGFGLAQNYPDNVALGRGAFNKVEYYENGDTAKVFIEEGSDYKSLCFFPGGDTMVIETETCVKDRCELDYKCWFGNGKLKSNYHRVDSTDGRVYCINIDLNEAGDTIRFSYEKEGMIHGRQIESFHFNKDLYSVISLWEMGKLIAILNENILYLDNNYKIIDEQTYLKLLNDKYEYTLEHLSKKVEIESGKTLELVAYPPNWSIPKVLKKIKKIEAKYGVDQ